MNENERAALEARVVDALTILVFVCFALGCTYAIGSTWQWGHNGFNGAAFSQAARNSLRFHIVGQAQYYTGLTPPAPATLYTHHPLMLHLHLVVLFKLLGAEPWVGRLIPATYSFLTLVLLHRISLRWWDRMTALVAIALYAFTPLHSIFANMIDHEQGAIFWTLLAVWAYLRFGEAAERKHLLLACFAISVAAQFDWPPYYIAFFVALHAFGSGLLRGRPILRWRSEWTFLVAFSFVVLVNFGAFFAWIRRQRGSLAEMGQAYALRTGHATGDIATQYQRLVDLYGPVVLWIVVLWLVLLVVRLRARELRSRDLLPGCFFAAQVLHSLLFRNAGSIHSYWTYWAGITVALGGADVVVTVFRTLAAWLRDRPRARIARLALIVAGFAIVLFQVRYAYARLRWGFRNGSAAYVTPLPDVRSQVRMAQYLAARFPRTETFYLFQESVHARIEVHWYHDTPFDTRTVLAPLPSDYVLAKHLVIVAEIGSVGERTLLWRLAREHPTWIFDRRFVAIDVMGQGGKIQSLRSQPQAPSLFWSWFVDPLRPKTEWVADDDAAATALLDGGPELTSILESDDRGGAPHGWDCPRGEYVAAVEGAIADTTPVIARLRARCARANGEASTDSPWFGGGTAKAASEARCPVGASIIGVESRKGRFLEALTPICAPLVGERVEQKLPSIGEGATGNRLVCPLGSVARGVRVRSGALVDGIGIACGPL